MGSTGDVGKGKEDCTWYSVVVLGARMGSRIWRGGEISELAYLFFFIPEDETLLAFFKMKL